MLFVKLKDGTRYHFYLIDGHTHIGKEEIIEFGKKNYRTNLPNQILDFFTRLQFNLLRDMKKNPNNFHFIPDEPFARPAAFIGGLSDEITKDRFTGYLIDQFVTFPFNDVKAAETTPQFQIPNDMILKRQQTPPFFTRMLGFVRVNPLDGETAVKEVIRCAEQGARGLKLHPISQHWVDNVTDPRVCAVVVAALNARLPVIFDCRFLKTAEDIYQLHQVIQKDVKNPNYGLILAHSGMEFNSTSLYQVLSDDHLFGDTSGMRSDDVGLFFKKFAEAAPQTWSNHVIFGTDFNYFTIPQATDLLEYLLSEDLFNKIHLSPLEIQRVLAGNLMSILPPFDLFSANDLGNDFVPAQHLRLVDARLLSVTEQLAAETARLIGKSCGRKVKDQEFAYVSFDPYVSAGRGFVDQTSFFTRPVAQVGPNPRILICLALPFDEKFGVSDEVKTQKVPPEVPQNVAQNAPENPETSVPLPDPTIAPPVKEIEIITSPISLPERFTYLVGLFECSAPLSRLNLRMRGITNPIVSYLRETIQKEVPIITQKDSLAGFLKTFLDT
jgi:predicted TIM-barrel fold metal-dependent hydrolase